jgi:hypothetical protein
MEEFVFNSVNSIFLWAKVDQVLSEQLHRLEAAQIGSLFKLL